MTGPLGDPDSETTRVLFSALIALVALGRLAELRRSRHNVRRALARGAREYGARHYPVMVALHAGFLVSCVAEVWLCQRGFRAVPGLLALCGVGLAFGLRYWTIHTLGERWTTRVLVVPGDAAVAAGPFRYLRHPNYLAVALEILALPLVHGAWLTAGVFTLANALLLRRRVAVEEAALRAHTDWSDALAHRFALRRPRAPR